MIDWYRTGKDPAREMVRLTTYLGHSDPSNTYWYLEAVPELLEFVNEICSEMVLPVSRPDAFTYSESDRFPAAIATPR